MTSAERLRAPWLGAPATVQVMTALTRDGAPARFVGGCVRDALLDPTADSHDLDVATAAPPGHTMRLLAAAGLPPLPTGLRHGTVSARLGSYRFEITTLRRDLACDGRHAEVVFTDDFDADAARRDFTINAISAEVDGTVHDPVGGRADLAAGRVRFVGDPRKRIAEDYLRILRFFRFHARFGRGAPDAAGLAACRELAHGIDRLSGERVRQELWLILAGPRPGAALAPMAETGVLAHAVPIPVTLDRLGRLAEDAPLAGLPGLALIRPAARAQVEALAERLRLGNRERERLTMLATAPLPDFAADARAQRAAVYRLGGAAYRDLLALAAADGLVDEAHRTELAQFAGGWRPPPFPLGGDDLLALGVAPGPGLGAILAQVRREWEAADFAWDRETCRARAAALLAPGDDLTP